MTMQRYHLITAPDEDGARRIAKAKGFGPQAWVFVPLQEDLRRGILEGRHGFHRSQLIGSFTEQEIEELTRNAA